MALTPFSILLRLRSSSASYSKTSLSQTPCFLKPQHQFQFLLLTSRYGKKPFSTSHSSSLLQPHLDHDPPPPDPRTKLSARMAFVFDQMDAIDHRDRSAEDEALQRIRSWHQTRQNQQSDHLAGDEDVSGSLSSEKQIEKNLREKNSFKKQLELAHPWPEWIELMERLLQQNYFDHRRVDEDQMFKNLPVDLSEIKDDTEFDFTRDWTTVRTACLNFGRDRFDILKSLSRKDIQVLVGHGCPSLDPKVVFSAKLLRKYVRLDEGDVCSSCSLRSSCSRGYLLTNKEDEARTLDVIRILTTYGFDSAIGSVENKPLMKMKLVKMVVRKLLHEIVKLSAVPIDPNLPPPVIKKPPPKVKQPPPPPKKRVGRDDIEMKKGDWLCPKCDFMNFAKNLVCLQCDAKRPKRQLLPGEWECTECNFLNYRRNMACFHCDHKRPPDEFTENERQEKQNDTGTRLQRAAKMPSVSNAWNFDFDDNESDGADVAAFEFADHSKMDEGSSLDSPPRGGITRGLEDNNTEKIMMSRTHERGRYFSERNEGIRSSHASRTGFDDFDEDDDVDSYEIDMQNSSPKRVVSSKSFSELDSITESEDFDTFEHYSKPNKGVKASLSGSDDDMHGFDSDSDLLEHQHLKSSHVADSRQWTRSGRSISPRKGTFRSDDRKLNYDSDDDVDLGFSSQKRKGRQQGSSRKGTGRGRSSGSEDELLLGSDSDGDGGLHSRVNARENKGGPNRRGGVFRGNNRTDSLRSGQFRPNDRSSRRASLRNADDDRSFRGSYRNGPGSYSNRRGGVRGNDRGSGFQDSNIGSLRDPFESNKRGRSSQLDGRSRDFGDERPRRRIIER